MNLASTSSIKSVHNSNFPPKIIALAGNPNCGKTTLFNTLTGLRQKIGNYPGVTVDKKEGKLSIENTDITVIDLPGTYSLSARSLDEQISRNVLLGKQEGTSRPDLILNIVDASNLERNLYLTTQLMELGCPVIIALNMVDTAAAQGIEVDHKKLSEQLGVPVLPIVANKAIGVDKLCATIIDANPVHPLRAWKFPEPVEKNILVLKKILTENGDFLDEVAEGEAIRLLLNEPDNSTRISSKVIKLQSELEEAGIDWWMVEAESRYQWIKKICSISVIIQSIPKHTVSDRIDSILTHRIAGLALFAILMAFVFQSIFTWAQMPMEFISNLFGKLSFLIKGLIPSGDLQGLLADGIVPGVGGVVTFLPQILILSFFISLLEDTGYMARAAFIMDRIMRRFGLNGKSFIPLLSSFACAIPGIMSTRTIENQKDRLVTILIAPLMSCSARLPVYTLLIGAFFPSNQRIGGIITVAGLVLFSMYFLGILAAALVAFIFRKTILRGEAAPLIMELPPYRFPAWRNILSSMTERGIQFLKRASTIILAISIVLWFLSAYPKNITFSKNYALEYAAVTSRFDKKEISENEKGVQIEKLKTEESSERLQKSYLGQIGHAIEPVIRPLGFNWKIGIGLLSAFAAREVLVSTMAIVYSVGQNSDEGFTDLQQVLQNDHYPDGKPVYTPLIAISLMVFFVLALQCMSTIAVVRRETNSWYWPLFMFGYMTILAYVTCLLVYQGGSLIGLG